VRRRGGRGRRKGGGREGLANLPWVPGQSRSKVKSGRRLPSGIFRELVLESRTRLWAVLVLVCGVVW